LTPSSLCVLVPFVSSRSPTAALTSSTDPRQDRAVAGGDTSSRTGRLLGLVHSLIDYGKDLASTPQHRTAATNLAAITRNFGTIDIALIVSYITRALHRAAALEARLILRIACKQDAPAPASTASPHRQPRAARPAAQRPNDANPRLAGLPTPEEIAADVRRRPIGAVLVDICRDFGIVPAHPLWRALTAAITDHGGNFVALFRAVTKRAFRSRRVPPAVAVYPGPAPAPAPYPPSPAASGAGPP
jgi:hypothetical protein